MKRAIFFFILLINFFSVSTTQAIPETRTFLRAVEIDYRRGFKTESWSVQTPLPSCEQFTSADFDADGLADLAVNSPSGIIWKKNLGSQFSDDRLLRPSSDETILFTPGRFSSECSLELLVFQKSNWSLLNPLTKELRSVSLLGEETITPTGISTGDLNADGIDDLLVLDEKKNAHYFLNNGLGQFAFLAQRSLKYKQHKPELIDLLGNAKAATIYPDPHQYEDYTFFYVSHLENVELNERWAQLDPPIKPSLWVRGDFDSDGRSDVLTFTGPIYRWWLFQSLGFSSIESPVDGIETEPIERESVAAADFNNDGQDDVIFCNTQKSFVKTALSQIAQAIKGVEIEKDAVEISPGYFDLKGATISPSEIKVPNYSFQLTNQHEQGYVASCPKKTLHLVGVSKLHDQKYQGQAIRVGPSAQGPYVCTGFNPVAEVKWTPYSYRCPEDYAYYAADDIGGSGRPKNTIPLNGICCRLPQDDMLSEQEIEVELECPDNYIAVGTTGPQNCNECEKKIVCRKINLQRYTLGEALPARYFGSGMSMRAYSERALDEEIPLAIRTGVTRSNFLKEQIDGCVGYPYGSVLVRKGHHCYDFRFRQFLYSGAQGDPHAGTPVVMYPTCRELEDPHSATAACIP